MTPDLLKKRFQEYQNAELKFKKAKISLKSAYSEMLYQFAKANDMDGFNACCVDAVADLGDSFNFSIISIKVIFNIKD